MSKEVHYRWIYRGDNYVKIDEESGKEVLPDSPEYKKGKKVLAAFFLEDSNHIPKNENFIGAMKEKINLKEGDKLHFVYAEKVEDGGFIEGLTSWNVIFDGEKFIEDEDNPSSNFLMIM